MTLNREQSLSTIRATLSKLPSRYQGESARALSLLESNTNDNVVAHFSLLSPKHFKILLSRSSELTDYELDIALDAIHDKNLLRFASYHSKYFINHLVAVLPAISVVPVYHVNAEAAESLKRLYVSQTMINATFARNDLSVIKSTIQMLTGHYFEVNESEKDSIRGAYMSGLAGGDLIKPKDQEWFGHNMEALVPFWKLFHDSGNFSRGYAEEVMARADEYGSALISGVL